MSARAYPIYRESGVEWIGRVPAHWLVQRLKASTLTCQNGVWGDEPAGDENDVICVRVADFDRTTLTVKLDDPTIRNVSARDREARQIRAGDLLIEKSGGGERQPVGTVVLYDHHHPAVCSNFVARIELTEGMNASFWRYVHAAAYAVRLTSVSIKQTSGIQNLDQSSYLNEYGPFPPPNEQSAIASFLDLEIRKIDDLVAEQRRLIALLKEKRQAVISQAVTKGLNPSVPMKDSGVEWLGKVPAHWSVMPLMWLTQPERPIMYGIVLPGPDVEEGIPILKGGNVKSSRMNLESMARTTAEIEAPFARARLRRGDLAYSIRGSIGDCEIVPVELENANITQDVARVAPARDVSPGWLRFALLAEPVKEALACGSLGAAVRGINIFDLKRVRIPTPQKQERNEIAEHLAIAVETSERLSAEAERAIALLRERRAALISAAVTGKIDVRHLAAQPEAQAA